MNENRGMPDVWTLRRAACGAAAGMAIALLAAAPAFAQVKNVVYACDDGTEFNASFDNSADTLTIQLPGEGPLLMQPARSGSGFRFTSGDYEIHGKGPNALLTRPGKPQTDCSAM